MTCAASFYEFCCPKLDTDRSESFEYVNWLYGFYSWLEIGFLKRLLGSLDSL